MKEEEIKEYLKKCTGCLRCEYFLGEDELGWGHCKLRDELDYIKNNKSNEEILKEFKEQIDSGNDYIHLWWKNAQGLLDLYNKEKEKNNELEKDNENLRMLKNKLSIATAIALDGRKISISKKTLNELNDMFSIEVEYRPFYDDYVFYAK